MYNKHSDSVTHIDTSILFQILFPYELLENIEYSFLFCTVGPCWLSFLYVVGSVYWSQISNLPLSHPFPVCFLCLWACFYFVDKFIYTLFFKVLHISGITWYLSFSVWLTSLSMIISRFIHVAANSIIFYGKVIFHRIYVPHLYQVICQWTFRLLPCPGYSKQCCSEHWGIYTFSNYGFPGVRLLDHMVVLFFNFLRILHSVLHSGCTNLHILSSICYL